MQTPDLEETLYPICLYLRHHIIWRQLTLLPETLLSETYMYIVRRPRISQFEPTVGATREASGAAIQVGTPDSTNKMRTVVLSYVIINQCTGLVNIRHGVSVVPAICHATAYRYTSCSTVTGTRDVLLDCPQYVQHRKLTVPSATGYEHSAL